LSGSIKDKTEEYSSPPTYTISKEVEGMVREIAVLIGRLLKGLFLFLGSEVKAHVIPRAVQLVHWLKRQTIILIRKSVKLGYPKVIEVGQISEGLLVLTARNLKTKGASVSIGFSRSIKNLTSLFYGKAKKIAKEKVSLIRRDIAAEKIKASSTSAILLSPEIIFKEEEAVGPNQRLARQLNHNGIKCQAPTKMDPFEIEVRPYYSYLFAMSPRIVTNRGYIRLSEGYGTRNIDFIQVIQKN
jgi:hypothetical protein